jgi:sec-independent protein translocase protein TatB
VLLDLNFTKLLVLGVIALVVFGPERLPAIASQAGRLLRELRKMAEGARTELQDSLGPEFGEFDIADLNPKHFVRKHLADELTGDGVLFKSAENGNGNGSTTQAIRTRSGITLAPGESPPFDAEAT